MRKHYFEHLTDVVIVDSHMLATERPGGADFDGDMIKAIADPVLNACVKRNYQYEKYNSLRNEDNIPLLKIPSVEPQIRDANDWCARFETIRNTFFRELGRFQMRHWTEVLSLTMKIRILNCASIAGRRRKY